MQSVIDSIDYPPTHTYQLNPLKPTGILAERVAVIERIAPELFEGESFLDVGANKGYFSLRAAGGCTTVTAIEPDPECVGLLREISSKMDLFHGTFGQFSAPTLGNFDRIFIGNGPHYLFREAGGWGWVEKLAKLSTGTVVLEGPTGMECVDMQKCLPLEIQEDFNRAVLLRAFAPYFEFQWSAPSPSYTPDRYVLRFERKDG